MYRNDFWHLKQWSPYSISDPVYEHLDVSNINQNVDIWIMDTGVDYTHIEFEDIIEIV